MLRKFATTAITAAIVAAPLTAFAEPVESVKVDVDLQALGNSRAAQHWTNIAEDLENEIVSRLVGNTVPEEEEGLRISIDIDEVVLANTLESAAGVAESELAGRVKISHESDNSAYEFYDLTVTYEQAKTYLVAGTDIAIIALDDRSYYDAMIDAFADRVVQNLD